MSRKPNGDTLVVVSPLRSMPRPNGRAILTRKFVAGATALSAGWPGPVTVLCESAPAPTDNLDNIEVEAARLPFQLVHCAFDAPDLVNYLRGSALVLGAAHHRQNRLSRLCRAIAVPCVYITEYTLRTRLQIIGVEQANPLIRLRRYWWEWNQERAQVAAVRLAAGVQCNGTPTWETYRHRNPRPLLFFDSGATTEMLATPSQLRARAADLHGERPLRLAFSGRLIRMKGADHLPRLARALVDLGVRFELFICGGGVLETGIRADIARLGLGDSVKMLGVLAFADELVPLLKTRIDLFVCCHPQGDPSTTYLETLSCGVPIAGYANEALLGLLRHAKVGWTAPTGDIAALARLIRDLDCNRNRLTGASAAAIDFARQHTTEQTITRRVDHLRAIASCQAASATRCN